MLIPVMYWPQTWDQPVGLNECEKIRKPVSESAHFEDNAADCTALDGSAVDCSAADFTKVLHHVLAAALNHLRHNPSLSAHDSNTGPTDRPRCRLLLDPDLIAAEKTAEFVKTAEEAGWVLQLSTLPDSSDWILAEQDRPLPVFVLAKTAVLKKLHYISRHRLIFSPGALPENVGNRLFEVEGFLPYELTARFEMKKAKLSSQCFFFHREPPENLIRERMQMGGCDLHVHTTASDSSDSPEQVCQRALEAGLKTIAISDHDNISAIDRMGASVRQANQSGNTLIFIPAVEISVQHERELHLLAYFPLGGQKRLELFLVEQQQSRERRNQDMIETLQSLGYAITLEELNAAGDHSVGRMQTALLLKARGYVETTAQAFAEILGEGKPGYIERPRPSLREAIYHIRIAGGIPVLAHPALYGWCSSKSDSECIETLITRFELYRSWGMLGIESFHGEARPAHQQRIAKAAAALGLLQTGGSDDHGKNKQNTRLYTGETKFLTYQ